MARIVALILSLGLLAGAPSPAVAAETAHLKLYIATGDFDTVKDDLEQVLAQNGFATELGAYIQELRRNAKIQIFLNEKRQHEISRVQPGLTHQTTDAFRNAVASGSLG